MLKMFLEKDPISNSPDIVPNTNVSSDNVSMK